MNRNFVETCILYTFLSVLFSTQKLVNTALLSSNLFVYMLYVSGYAVSNVVWCEHISSYVMDCVRQKLFMFFFVAVEEAVKMAWVLINISLFPHLPPNKIYKKY